MSTYTAEIYQGRFVGVDATESISTGSIVMAGFLPTTAGAMTIRDRDAAGTVIVSTVPLVAGQFCRVPLSLPNGGHIILSGAASGTVFWNPV